MLPPSSGDYLLALEENSSMLGPGLAVNVWSSFLCPVLTSSTPIQAELGRYLTRLAEAGQENLTMLSRLVILLPVDCNFQQEDKQNIHTCVPGLCWGSADNGKGSNMTLIVETMLKTFTGY